MSEPWTISAEEATALPWPIHRVRWTLEPDHVDGTFTCDGDERSKCHLTCVENCGAEQWPCGYDEATGAKHRMTSGKECNVVLFLSLQTAAEMYDGPTRAPRSAPISVSWEQDYYVWRYASDDTRGRP